MTTIRDLADTIADQHGVDRAAAIDVVRVHVDQISADADLWDADTQQLTDAGAQLVADAVTDSYRIGAVATSAEHLIERIADTAAAKDAAEKSARDLGDTLAQLIRAAMRTELRRADIAAAARVSEARLYQIRDGRR